jgi:hypothetical protein
VVEVPPSRTALVNLHAHEAGVENGTNQLRLHLGRIIHRGDAGHHLIGREPRCSSLHHRLVLGDGGHAARRRARRYASEARDGWMRAMDMDAQRAREGALVGAHGGGDARASMGSAACVESSRLAERHVQRSDGADRRRCAAARSISVVIWWASPQGPPSRGDPRRGVPHCEGFPHGPLPQSTCSPIIGRGRPRAFSPAAAC